MHFMSTKSLCGWGSTPNPTGEAYSASSHLLAGLGKKAGKGLRNDPPTQILDYVCVFNVFCITPVAMPLNVALTELRQNCNQ